MNSAKNISSIACIATLLVSAIPIISTPELIELPICQTAPVAHFAAKGDALHSDCGHVRRAENDLFFYGFWAPNQKIAQHCGLVKIS